MMFFLLVALGNNCLVRTFPLRRSMYLDDFLPHFFLVYVHCITHVCTSTTCFYFVALSIEPSSHAYRTYHDFCSLALIKRPCAPSTSRSASTGQAHIWTLSYVLNLTDKAILSPKIPILGPFMQRDL